jgi:hypothetical protein
VWPRRPSPVNAISDKSQLRSRTDPGSNDSRSPDRRMRCSAGTESSSPTSSTDRSFANPEVVPELTRKPSGWWCGWRKENPGWGDDRIVGAMANLDLRLSDQTWAILSLANCNFAHDSSGFPVRLPFFDAQSGGGSRVRSHLGSS